MALEYLRKREWSPYVVGALMGILLTALFIYGQQIGVSTGISRVAALLEEGVAPQHVSKTPYFSQLLSDQVILNWKVLFILGLFLGAHFSFRLSGKRGQRNTIWEMAFGPSKAKRYFAAFLGGIFLLFGARLADGCTSGHAISGGAQFALTSWVFMMALFATAIPVSLMLYRKR